MTDRLRKCRTQSIDTSHSIPESFSSSSPFWTASSTATAWSKPWTYRARDGFRWTPANLYRCVKRLLREDLVREAGKHRSPESNDERRKYFAITALGRKVVAAEAERLDRIASAARARKLIPGRR